MRDLKKDAGRIVRVIFLRLLLPMAFIIYISYEPNFAHGQINYLESGTYLSAINNIFHNQILFKDTYILFNPLSYYFPSLMMLVFGKTLAVLRGFFMIGNMAAFLTLFFICASFIKNRFFAIFTALIVIIQAHNPYWSSRWGGFRLASGYLFILFLILYFKKVEKKYAVLSGFAAATAFLFGFDMGILCFLTLLSTLVLGLVSNKEEKKILSSLLVYSAIGALMAFAPFILYLVFNGAAIPFFNEILSLPARRVWAQPIFLQYHNLTKMLYPLIAYFLAFIYVVREFKKNNVEALSLFAVSIFGLLSYIYALRGAIGPQFTVASAFAVIPAFFLINKAIEFTKGNTLRNKILLTGISIIGISVSIFLENKYFKNNLTNWIMYQKEKFTITPDYKGYPEEQAKLREVDPSIERLNGSHFPEWQRDEIEGIVKRVRKETTEKDVLLCFPDLDFFNFLTDRPQASRFSITGFSWAKKEWSQELLEDLKSKKPKIILMRTGISNLAASIQRRQEILPEIVEYIKDNYELNEKIGGISIYSLDKLQSK